MQVMHCVLGCCEWCGAEFLECSARQRLGRHCNADLGCCLCDGTGLNNYPQSLNSSYSSYTVQQQHQQQAPAASKPAAAPAAPARLQVLRHPLRAKGLQPITPCVTSFLLPSACQRAARFRAACVTTLCLTLKRLTRQSLALRQDAATSSQPFYTAASYNAQAAAPASQAASSYSSLGTYSSQVASLPAASQPSYGYPAAAASAAQPSYQQQQQQHQQQQQQSAPAQAYQQHYKQQQQYGAQHAASAVQQAYQQPYDTQSVGSDAASSAAQSAKHAVRSLPQRAAQPERRCGQFMVTEHRQHQGTKCLGGTGNITLMGRARRH